MDDIKRVADQWAATTATERQAAIASAPATMPGMQGGQILTRMPVGLHDALKARALAEGVSLNQLVVALLAGSMRWADPDAKPKRKRKKKAQGK